MHVPGNGINMSLWMHNWGFGVLKMELPNLYTHALNTTTTLVQAVTSQDIRGMFVHSLPILAEQELQKLRQLLQSTTLDQHAHDDIQWKWKASGQFTVKSAYTALKDGPRIITRQQNIWEWKVPPRIRVFGWLTSLNRILTIDNLIKKGWTLVNRCPMRKLNLESVQHLFNECPFAINLYQDLHTHNLLTVPGNKLPTEVILDTTI